MRFPCSALLLAIPVALTAQQPERIALEGRDIAIYNLVGRLTVDGGTGDKVIVEVTRGGRDASRLKLESGTVHGRAALRVIYPDDRIYYSDSRWNGRTTFSVADDGTWGDDRNGRSSERRRIEVSSRGDGLDAHADLHVIIPKGRTVLLRQGVGETTIDNVEGNLDVDVASSHSRVSRIRGALTIESGSGSVDVSDVTGDVKIDAGSGGATVEGIHGTALHLDIGSGSFRGRAIDVSELVGDVGSGGMRIAGLKTQRLRLDVGSGGTDVEFLTSPDDVKIEAGSGGVTLRLPATTSATVDAEGGSGGIDTDFEVKLSRIERRALHGSIGGGKGRIQIETGSGTIRLLKNAR